MAKKTKRQIRRDVNPKQEKPVADPLVANRPTGFNPDYQFVIRDVQRVGLLAGSFIIILVALAIFLR